MKLDFQHCTEAVDYVLMSEEEIASTCDRIAAEITRDYAGSNRKLVLICIMKGSVMFTAELMKRIDLPLEFECMRVSSYHNGTSSTGNIIIRLDLDRRDLSECDVLVVEDIIDSGRTLLHLTNHLRDRGAGSVRTCTLLDKPSRREVDFTPDYCGKQIPDKFVIGFGLDFAEIFRNLPFIGVLKPEYYEN